MIKVGENEVKSKVVKVLKEENRGYLLSEYKEGFKIYLSDQPLIYVFEYTEMSGWIIYADLREDNFGDPIIVEEPAYVKFEEIVDKYNFDNFAYAEDANIKFKEESAVIERFFETYKPLIQTQLKDSNELTYRFKKIKGVQPIAHVRYAPGMDFWNLSFNNFMLGEHIIDSLYEVFQGAEELIYNLNKDGLHED